MRLLARSCAATLAALSVGTAAAQELRLPLGDRSAWQVLQYRNLPPHRVGFSSTGLEIAVDGSAMPLIYPLPKPMAVREVRVKGRVEGTLRAPPGRQGDDKYDDYVFRIGLVEAGNRRLNPLERRFAPAWVRKLHELAPKGSGIARIQFFNVAAEQSQVGRRRQHPLSDLIFEEAVVAQRADGRFDFVHALERPLQTLAVWLSSDGDDTGSRFTVRVEEIELR